MESESCQIKSRYYENNSIVPFEEDATHEFKQHCNLSEDEIPPWTHPNYPEKKTRSRVSKSLNAFLNAGRAATVYLGILDDGRVAGFCLTAFKMDHMTQSLDDLFARYDPPVDRHRYSIQFVPVIDQSASPDEIRNILSFDPRSSAPAESRRRKHYLRTPQPCWCVKDCLAQFSNGIIAPSYVIEIHIHAWNNDDPRNTNCVGQLRAPPLHKDECGQVYIRQQSASFQLKPADLYSFVRQKISLTYEQMIKRLIEELEELKLREANIKQTIA